MNNFEKIIADALKLSPSEVGRVGWMEAIKRQLLPAIHTDLSRVPLVGSIVRVLWKR